MHSNLKAVNWYMKDVTKSKRSIYKSDGILSSPKWDLIIIIITSTTCKWNKYIV